MQCLNISELDIPNYNSDLFWIINGVYYVKKLTEEEEEIRGSIYLCSKKDAIKKYIFSSITY